MGIFTGTPINTKRVDTSTIKVPEKPNLQESVTKTTADYTNTVLGNFNNETELCYQNDTEKVIFQSQDKVTKENNFHKKKLLELCEGYSEDEVRIACKVFARRFPNAMYDSLRDEHQNMVSMVTGVQQLQTSYLEKMGVI